MQPLVRIRAYSDRPADAASPLPLPATHGLFKQFRSVTAYPDSLDILYTAIPDDYLCVELSDLEQQQIDGSIAPEDGVLFHLSTYRSVAALLHDLYAGYLTHRFPPQSYGHAWVLAAELGWINQVMLPWQLLSPARERASSVLSHWAQEQPLEPFVIQHNPHWAIKAPQSLIMIGLAVHDLRIAQAIESYPRILYRLEQNGVLQPTPSALVSLDSTYATYVYSVNHRHLERVQRNAVYIQQETPKASYEALIQAFLDER